MRAASAAAAADIAIAIAAAAVVVVVVADLPLGVKIEFIHISSVTSVHLQVYTVNQKIKCHLDLLFLFGLGSGLAFRFVSKIMDGLAGISVS